MKHYLKPIVLDGKLVVPEEDIKLNREYMYLDSDGDWVHGRIKRESYGLSLVSSSHWGGLTSYRYVYSIEREN